VGGDDDCVFGDTVTACCLMKQALRTASVDACCLMKQDARAAQRHKVETTRSWKQGQFDAIRSRRDQDVGSRLDQDVGTCHCQLSVL
jgi:hydroxyethylthiazole kinase-like sugar kinase family protein